MNCPKCGFEQPEDMFCASCGVNMASYAAAGRVRGRVGIIAALFITTIIVAILIIALRPAPKEKADDPVFNDPDIPIETVQQEPDTPAPTKLAPTTPTTPEPQPVEPEPAISDTPKMDEPPTEEQPEEEEEDENLLDIPRHQVEIKGTSLMFLYGLKVSGLKFYYMKEKYFTEARMLIIDGPEGNPDGIIGPEDLLFLDSSEFGPEAPKEEWPKGFDKVGRIEIKAGSNLGSGRIYIFYFEYPPTVPIDALVRSSGQASSFATGNFTVQMDSSRARAISSYSAGNSPNILNGEHIFINTGELEVKEDELTQTDQNVFQGSLGIASRTYFDVSGSQGARLMIEDIVFDDRVTRRFSMTFEGDLPQVSGNISLLYELSNSFHQSGKLLWQAGPEKGVSFAELPASPQKPSGKWYAACDNFDNAGMVIKVDKVVLRNWYDPEETSMVIPFVSEFSSGADSAEINILIMPIKGSCQVSTIRPMLHNPVITSISVKELLGR